jgi:CheY-like chemotaxis protein
MPETKRVLVIDDEQMPRELLRSILEGQGYSVRVAENGESGLEQIAQDPPDLVLLDLAMEGLSGWGVINRLRIRRSPPPVIAMSALGDEEPPELTAISPFVHGYLPKPFRADQISAACARVLALQGPNEAPPEPDRRSEARRDLVLVGTLASLDGTPVATGELLDITTGGAQFNVGASLPSGVLMILEFDVPGGDGPFRITVQSQWNEEGKAGLVFVDMAEADKGRLARLLAPPG